MKLILLEKSLEKILCHVLRLTKLRITDSPCFHLTANAITKLKLIFTWKNLQKLFLIYAPLAIGN